MMLAPTHPTCHPVPSKHTTSYPASANGWLSAYHRYGNFMASPQRPRLCQARACPQLVGMQADVSARRIATKWNLRLSKQLSSNPSLLDTLDPLLLHHLSSPQPGSGSTLAMWACSSALPKHLQQQGHSVVAVEPCRDAVDLIKADLGLQDPRGIAHDGWLRYTGDDMQLYRGMPHQLSQPVLSLAGSISHAVDPWGLLVTPPEMLGRYLNILSCILPAGGTVLALALGEHHSDASAADAAGVARVSTGLSAGGSVASAVDGISDVGHDAKAADQSVGASSASLDGALDWPYLAWGLADQQQELTDIARAQMFTVEQVDCCVQDVTAYAWLMEGSVATAAAADVHGTVPVVKHLLRLTRM